MAGDIVESPAAAATAGADHCAQYFQTIKCPENSIATGPYEWTDSSNESFKILYEDGTCGSIYKAAGISPDLGCNSQVRVCASKKTGKLNGPFFACNDARRVELNFSEGKLNGAAFVYSPKMTIVKRTDYTNGKSSRSIVTATTAKKANRTISSEKPIEADVKSKN